MTIQSARLDELARRLAKLTGEDVETAIERAVQERLARISVAIPKDREAALRRFVEEVSALPVRDGRPVEDILSYGADGLPV